MGEVIGLDIGGANLKAANTQGWAISQSFAVWKHPDQLAVALSELLQGQQPSGLAITMTGELCDCYETKQDGVNRILAEVERAFPTTPIQVWSTDGRFLSPSEAHANHLKVAASNWHALATIVGKRSSDPMLLIDIGSTTTDIIPIANHKPAPQGFSDFERLQSKELVYTGVRRTPVCALLQEQVMAELFATTLDAYLLLGDIPEVGSNRETADGRPATRKLAHARLARMLGSDSYWSPEEATRKLAFLIRLRQQSLIADAIRTVLARQSTAPGTIVLSGSGEFLARQTLVGMGIDARLVSLTDEWGHERSAAACAHAVAVLAEGA